MNPENFLEQLDHQLFTWINTGLSNPVFDAVFPNITDLQKSGAFLGLVALVLLYSLYHARMFAVRVWVGVLFTAALADTLAYRAIKVPFHRLRPEAVMSEVILRTNSHSGFSFPSNHATNAFAVATFLALTFPRFEVFCYGLAALVAFSRVYVGVHFPSDVIGGAIIGILVGTFTRIVFKKIETKVGRGARR
jgi:undecaprenyl-diphosphatase